jgi:hypothetical protein
MSRKRRNRLEQAIEDALAPGTFIGQRNSWSFAP